MIATDTTERTTWRIDRLRPHPRNPRGRVSEDDAWDLVASIREQGILEPLIVAPDGVILCGERRWVAARLAGLAEVPVVVHPARTLGEQIAVMLTENLQRQDLTPLQEARAFRAMLDLGLGANEVARRVGVSTNYIRTRLAIIQLDNQVQELFGRRELPASLAPVLSKVADREQQRRLAARAATRQMTVTQIEETISRGLGMGTIQRAESRAVVIPASQSTKSAPVRWPTRQEAIDLLRKDPDRQVSYQAVERLFDATCGVCSECGLLKLEVACRECPLPRFVARLVQ